jgi:predicted deacylase
MSVVRAIHLLSKYFLTSKPANSPERQTDFIMHLEHVDLNAYYQQLLSFSDIVQVSMIVKIVYQGKDYPVYQINHSGSQAKHRLLVIAGVHGNEVAGILAVPKILEDIRKHPDIYKSWNITILSPVNPVGAKHESRYNGQGYDSNRDFKNFHTLEARLQRDAILQLKPDFIISLHEGPHQGFFFIPMRNVPKTLVFQIREHLINKNITLATKDFIRLPLSYSGIMRDSWYIQLAKRLFSIHTLDSYADTLGIPTITTESSWSDENISQRVITHIETTRAVLVNFHSHAKT